MLIQKPKGTYDILPGNSFQRTFLENKLRNIFSGYNYEEIRTPAFEKTELFKRGIGEETDIVSKEMYSFNEGEFTLKPEMTAPVVRAYLENSLFNESPVRKLFYICNMFRSERPQAGRFREFSQFGAELIGSNDCFADIEMIILADAILKSFGIKGITVKLNTIGTLNERESYISELKKYLKNFSGKLSKDSERRLEKNALRVLDSKDPGDIEILEQAPVIQEFLKQETLDHFDRILSGLKSNGISFETDFKLVRGIDYYTSTVFEFVSDSLGAQNTVIGGGRYDVLVEMLGGKPTPAIGFAAGIERMLMILEKQKFDFPPEPPLKLYFVTIGEAAKSFCMNLMKQLRSTGIKCETDFLNRSVKSQMKEANRMNAEYVVVIGDEELKNNSAMLRKMSDSTEIKIEDLQNIKQLLQ